MQLKAKNNARTNMVTKLAIACMMMFLCFACKQNKTEVQVISKDKDTRTTKEELDFIKAKALSLNKNSSGNWEATFEDGIILIYVPEGSFIMGNNKIAQALPEHKVHLSHYWFSKNPITIGQFRTFVNETNYITEVLKEGHSGPWVYDFNEQGFIPKYGYYWDNAFNDVIAKFPEITKTDHHPVGSVTWNDAIAFTDWLSQKTGLQISLPTEAEWEYAARGNDERIYPWGNEDPDGTKANYADETFDKYFPGTEQALVHHGINDGFAITSPVGSFPNGKSPIGAMDMAGNLTEWVYDSQYNLTEAEAIEVTNPIYTKKNGENMEKGGLWCGSAGRVGQTPDEIEFGHNIRTDTRPADESDSADDHMGFRIAISYTPRN